MLERRAVIAKKTSRSSAPVLQRIRISMSTSWYRTASTSAPRASRQTVNSQHSHETAEVFIVHTGRWRFMTGEFGKDGQVDLGPGDVISIPTQVFRGFENIGSDIGFMFAVLGGDHPGRVTWAPYVFAAAAQHGLVLLDDGRLVDTTRESVQPDATRMPITNGTDMARLRHLDNAALAACVLHSNEMLGTGGGLSRNAGVEECALIGPANAAEGMSAGKMAWQHGFHLRRLRLQANAVCAPHSRADEEVLLLHEGELTVSWRGGSVTLHAGDTLTIPKALPRGFHNGGAAPVIAYVVRGGDAPSAAESRAAL